MELELDARNLLCPLPVIRVQDCIKNLSANDILTVYCTDPGVKYDIPAWCRMRGHGIVRIEEKDREIIITIQIGTDLRV